jgi:hypothetical protein
MLILEKYNKSKKKFKTKKNIKIVFIFIKILFLFQINFFYWSFIGWDLDKRIRILENKLFKWRFN